LSHSVTFHINLVSFFPNVIFIIILLSQDNEALTELNANASVLRVCWWRILSQEFHFCANVMPEILLWSLRCQISSDDARNSRQVNAWCLSLLINGAQALFCNKYLC